MTEKWVTLQQAAVALGVSESTIRRRRDAGELQSKQENRRHLIKMDTTATPNGATLAPDNANMTPNMMPKSPQNDPKHDATMTPK